MGGGYDQIESEDNGIYAATPSVSHSMSTQLDALRQEEQTLAGHLRRVRSAMRGGAKYDHRAHVSQKAAEKSAAQNEIAPEIEAALESGLHDLHATDRESILDSARHDFRWFCEWAFPSAFPLAWSPSHIKLLDRTQRAVLDGGQTAIAMPRGSGKSTIFERAILWAVLFGHRRYPVLICADEPKAKQRLRTIKVELESSERLRWLFPHAVVPIQALERKAIRTRSQTYHGRSTYVEWAADHVALPFIDESPSVGAAFLIGGITSAAVRGPLHTLPNGESLRPDLVLIDDPQTRESAKSPSQVAEREQIINADIMGMAGPGKDIAALLACTVIYQNDLADRILDRAVHPNWQGERVAMIIQWPTNIDQWQQYGDIYENCRRSEQPITPAVEYYTANRDAMDAGAEVYWEARKLPNDVSALQHAMNLHFADPVGFASEYQNEPKPILAEDKSLLSANEIACKVNGVPRQVVPRECTKLVAFIDVQQDILIYTVCGFAEGFTGYVVDYGCFPDQGRIYWEKSNIRRTYAQEAASAGVANKWESALLWAVDELTSTLCNRDWQTDAGSTLKMDRVLIDSKWGKSRELIVMACRKTSAPLMPSQGIYIGAASKPMSDYKQRMGETLGLNWRIATPEGWPLKCVSIDSNWWKSFVHQRWSSPLGEKGCLSLFDGKRHQHQMFADHQRSESRVETEGRGRKVDEWKQGPADNDFFDCLVGCHVAASIEGIDLVGARRDSIGARATRTAISAAEALARRRAMR